MNVHAVVRSTRPFHMNGGLERASGDLHAALAVLGVTVTVYTPTGDEAVGSRLLNLDYVDVPWPSVNARLSKVLFPSAYSLWCKRASTELLDRIVPGDIVLLHGAALNIAPLIAQAEGFVVSNPHGLEEFGRGALKSAPSRFLLRRMIRSGAPYADTVVSTDSSLTDFVVSALDLDRAKVVEIANGIDVRAIQENRGSCIPDDFLICSVGRLAFNKGFDLLATALADLHDAGTLPKSWRWEHFGNGGELHTVSRVIATRGIQNQCTIRTGESDSVVRSAIQRSSLFVQPSRYEGSSLTTLEAMALGALIVGTPVGGIPDKIIDGRTGYLAKEASASAIREAIEKALDTGNEERLRSAASEFVAERFDLPVLARKYRDLFAALGERREH